MAMTLQRNGNSDAIVEMNTTPLIDVMLVLLVMLIITIPIQTHAVRLNMPSVVPVHPAPAVHLLSVDFDGSIQWDGKPVPSPAALDGYFSAVARQQDQPEIRVQPNRLAAYGIVARIMADAQRLGVTRIGFTGEEQYLR